MIGSIIKQRINDGFHELCHFGLWHFEDQFGQIIWFSLKEIEEMLISFQSVVTSLAQALQSFGHGMAILPMFGQFLVMWDNILQKIKNFLHVQIIQICPLSFFLAFKNQFTLFKILPSNKSYWNLLQKLLFNGIKPKLTMYIRIEFSLYILTLSALHR